MFYDEPLYKVTFGNGSVLNCYVAITKKEKATGLRAMPKLGGAEGLWFSYPDDCQPMFWNKGVPYDVEIACISTSDMKVNNILSLKANSSDILIVPIPSKYIIETRAGTFKNLNIEVGTHLDDIRSLL